MVAVDIKGEGEGADEREVDGEGGWNGSLEVGGGDEGMVLD